MGGIRKYIADTLLVGLEDHPGKRVLLCGSDTMLYNMAREKLPGMIIECLHQSEIENFVNQIDVPVAESYDYILDMGLIEESNWDSQLIRAMGLHLSRSDCQLRIAFPVPGNVQDRYEAYGRIYAGCFKNVGWQGISSDGKLFWEPNWSSKHRRSCWIVVGCIDFNFREAWLQSFYTPELRWDICMRLCRIEYDIAPEENAKDVLVLVKQHQVNRNYFSRLLSSVAINEAKVRAVLEKAGMDFD